MKECRSEFFVRYYEAKNREFFHHGFRLSERQWQTEWNDLVSAAAKAKQSLDSFHVFVMAHVLRRPIVVYSDQELKNFRGESTQHSNVGGIYLPLLWPDNLATKEPIALSYTRGHFNALIACEPPVQTYPVR